MPKTAPRPVVPRRPAVTLALADAAVPMALVGMGVALAALVWQRGEAALPLAPLLFGGWLVGVFVLRLYPQHYRVIGFVPAAAGVGAVVAVVGYFTDWPGWLVGLFAFCQGVAVGALLRYRDHFRDNPARFGLAALGGVLAAAGAVAAFQGIGGAADDWRETYRLALIGVSVLLTVFGTVAFARPAAELVIDPFGRLSYDCRAAGPGVKVVPKTGPCLVIANHAAWFDPLFIAEVVPREITPLMTSGFYDLPVLKTLMRRVFRVIRVAEQAARRDAPEIAEAVGALDRGQCVVIFPEGYLRRKEEVPLKRFGQGVWQILRARPNTPVIACWIEGSWGSYFSHHNGPPTRNKKRDFRRPIAVGMSPPIVVPAELLADHLATRVYLMNQVLAARGHLGLEALPPVELPVRGEEGEEKGAVE